LLQNGSFECGLNGWQILQGTARVADAGAIEGRYAVEVTADSLGQARLNSVSPIAIDDATTLCVAAKVQGTVTKVRLEVLRSPDNWSVGFTSPVTSSWVSLPPSKLAVEVPRNSQVWVVVRAVDAAAGQQLWVDDLVMEEGANGHCP